MLQEFPEFSHHSSCLLWRTDMQQEHILNKFYIHACHCAYNLFLI